MDLIKSIRTFISVADKGSFSATANHLNIAVSAVSRQVTELEEHFGCQLLYRTTRTMQLSEQGQILLRELRGIIEQLDNLQQLSLQKSQVIAGDITVSSPFHSEGMGLSNILSEFCETYPAVNVSWLMFNRRVNLIDEGIDVAIRAGKLVDSSLIARKYSSLEVVFVASPDYINKFGLPESPLELVNHKCIVETKDEGNTRWRYLDSGKEKHIQIKGSIRVNKPNMAAKFSSLGKGIVQLPKYMVQQGLDNGDLVLVMESYNPAPLDLYLVYPSKKLMKPALKAFIEFFLARTEKGQVCS
ncbi:LysR family transcriptional regulator [Pseudoalteromonas rubra]|uniref:HTH lysR-type domain-containing protein n=1 Tax=Pseudoalteromonas rubra TaxID=43658 RepID=A0A0U3H403_9GAMM|nr:LysR family transcriptional regulator [Pseudoalteromonas rubra]ALU46019.1 hypothetical protein AT705_24175 [Pseudoalteromonas rubra]